MKLIKILFCLFLGVSCFAQTQERVSKSFAKTTREAPQIKWKSAISSRYLNIKIEEDKSDIGTPNLTMKFDAARQTLSNNMPWMMTERDGVSAHKADVIVYANKRSFIRNEKLEDAQWTGGFYDPNSRRVVMYDQPDSVAKMLALFSHELTHLFVDAFYNPKIPQEREFSVEPPVWLNEGIAVNMEDISADYKGGVWADDLINMNILSSGDRKVLSASAPRRFTRPSLRATFFINFAEFMDYSSYDKAVAAGGEENWYRQAYAMVRFLFKPYNARYPEKSIQFQQFTSLLRSGAVKNSDGAAFIPLPAVEAALKKAYGFRNIADFEIKFWSWMRSNKKRGRPKDDDGFTSFAGQ
jgi:hypothetical protein